MQKNNSSISNLITTVFIQLTQSVVMKLIYEKFLPLINKLLKYICYIGISKLIIYLLCITVLLYFLQKMYKLFRCVSSSSSKCSSGSNSFDSFSSFESTKKCKKDKKCKSEKKCKKDKKCKIKKEKTSSDRLSSVTSSSNDFVIDASRGARQIKKHIANDIKKIKNNFEHDNKKVKKNKKKHEELISSTN